MGALNHFLTGRIDRDGHWICNFFGLGLFDLLFLYHLILLQFQGSIHQLCKAETRKPDVSAQQKCFPWRVIKYSTDRYETILITTRDSMNCAMPQIK